MTGRATNRRLHAAHRSPQQQFGLFFFFAVAWLSWCCEVTGAPRVEPSVRGAAPHVEIPESVKVTVNFTPWQPVGAVGESFTRLRMVWLPLVVLALTVTGGEKG